MLTRTRGSFGGSAAVLFSIQYLRAVAALSVVVFHATWTANQTFHTIPPVQCPAAGVDIFFVISGFIMWVTALDQPPDIFFKNRITRIVPLYWAVTVALYFGWLLVGHAAPPPVDLLKSLTFIPYVAENGALEPVVSVGWTLNYEMFFYALFAASLMAPKSLRPAILLSTLSLLVIAGTVWHVAPPWTFYTSPLLLEFTSGVFLGMAFGALGIPGKRGGAALILIGVFCLMASELHPPGDSHWRRMIVWGLPAFCIVMGALSFDSESCVRPLKAAGDASYSIYLSHALVISAVKSTLLAIGINGLEASVLLVALSIPASGLIGFAIYSLIERPLLAYIRTDRRYSTPYPRSSRSA